MKTTRNYGDYTYQISTNPSLWGSHVTDDEAARYNTRLATMLQSQFPGLVVGDARSDGPDPDVSEAIEAWVQDHWTEACES